MTLLPHFFSAVSARLDPLSLFLDADIVVQLVMLGLILASIWVWTKEYLCHLHIHMVTDHHCQLFATRRRPRRPLARLRGRVLGYP